MSRYDMSDSGSGYSNKFSSVPVNHGGIARLRSVSLVARERNTLNRGPLFNLLKKVSVIDKIVRGAVPSLEPRVRPAIPRIHRLDLVSPLLSSLDDLPVRADTVRTNGARSRRSSHASSSNARVACRSGETVRVRSRENIGHHASGAGTGDVNLVTVGSVCVDDIVDHADENLAVALAIVLERLGAGDIPAVKVLLR